MRLKLLIVTIFIFLIPVLIHLGTVEGKVTSLRDGVEELIHSNGYAHETYEVETKDFYRLKLHRVVAKNKSPATKPLGPVFFMHGLIATAADYILNRANSLPFILSSMGYDCWLGNSRGTDYSQKHKFLSIQSKAYWNFSFHEIGFYDVPAMFDFMLSKTNSSKGYYIGHSQGGATLMVLLSTRPQYNKKIIQAHLFAPAVFMANLPHPVVRVMSKDFNAWIHRYRAYDFLSTMQILKFIESMAGAFCHQSSFGFNMCTNAMLMVCGYNKYGQEFEPNVISLLATHLASSISTKQLHHFIQLYQSGKFQQYDYPKINQMVYNQSSPPEYNLKSVIATTFIYSGKCDLLVSDKDIEHLASVLPNVKKHRIYRNYNHCDFNYGANSRRNIFDFLISSMNQNK